MAFRGWVSRDAAIATSEPVATYRGGMRLGFTGIASWSYPLVRLTLYNDGLEIGPAAPFLKLVVPLWRALFQEIDCITMLTRGRARGLRFTTRDGAFVIFGTFRTDPLIQALNQLGARIDPVPKRFRYFKPLA
ncbi:MAG TPA: hypothetical protein VMS00_10010 [Acidimicrobiales bacterium]|nr:hypothetical protein [Acidimicrobiales bacterium]